MNPKIALLPLSGLLASCGGLNDALSYQDLANLQVSAPTGRDAIEVTRNLDLKFTRGAIATEYTAKLSKGSYGVVAVGKNGTFYQTPYGGFEYGKAGDTESRVGGIFMPGSNGSPQVWFFPKAVTRSQWETIQANGWPSKPEGIRGVPVRAWVERDFVVPAGSVGTSG